MSQEGGGGGKFFESFSDQFFRHFRQFSALFACLKKKRKKKTTLQILIKLKPHAIFHNPTITLSGRKVTRVERKKEKKKKNDFSFMTAHANRSDQNGCVKPLIYMYQAKCVCCPWALQTLHSGHYKQTYCKIIWLHSLAYILLCALTWLH